VDQPVAICKKCGEEKSSDLKNFKVGGRGKINLNTCRDCINKRSRLRYIEDEPGARKRNRDNFFRKCSAIHNNKYSYLSEYQRWDKKIKISCPTHGIFFQVASDHLAKKGCPKCRSSKGELKIESLLKKSNIKFQNQKTFDSCINPRSNYKLRFDFFLPKLNVLIEYDGEQHFKEKSIWEPLKDVQYRDKLKNKWALDNYIHLIRISYKENIAGKLKKCNII